MALLARDSICWKFKGIFEKLQNHKTALIKGLSFICIVLLCAFVIHWFLLWEEEKLDWIGQPQRDLVHTRMDMSDECPTVSGEWEWYQLMEKWRREVGMSDDVTAEDLAEELLQTTLPGFKADTQFESKYDYGVTHTVSIDLEKRGSQFMARIIIHEKSSDAPSHGGSSFRTDVKGHRSKNFCPYKDYLNGTYLICCDVLEEKVDIAIYHKYTNFMAYHDDEKWANRGKQVIWKTNVLTPSGVKVVRRDQEDCQLTVDDVTYGRGAWYKVHGRWEWVVDGCIFHGPSREETLQCLENKYHNSFLSLGDNNIKNLFYYMMFLMEIPDETIEKEDHMLRHKDFMYKKVMVLSLFQNALEEIIDKSHNHVPNLLLMDLGVWTLASPSLANFILQVRHSVRLLRSIREAGAYTIFQDIPAVASERTNTSATQRSNHLVGALDYYMCSRMRAIGVTCIPQWKLTQAWADELLCGHAAQPMCLTDDSTFEVSPSGRVTSQLLLQDMCSN